MVKTLSKMQPFYSIIAIFNLASPTTPPDLGYCNGSILLTGCPHASLAKFVAKTNDRKFDPRRRRDNMVVKSPAKIAHSLGFHGNS